MNVSLEGKRFTKNVTLDELINCVLFLSFPFSFYKVNLIRQLMKIFDFFSKRIWVGRFFFNIYSYCWITSRVWGRYGSNIRTYTVPSSKHQILLSFQVLFWEVEYNMINKKFLPYYYSWKKSSKFMKKWNFFSWWNEKENIFQIKFCLPRCFLVKSIRSYPLWFPMF